MDASLLYQSVCDQLKELQIKLGYAYESTRFYYKVTSVNALTGANAKDVNELCRQLHAGHALEGTPLGNVTFGSHEDRLEVRVPPTGAQYVHEQMPEPRFLTALIELFLTNHHATQEQILALFAQFTPNYVVEQVPEGFGFDFSVHFEDERIDPYYYCFTNETGHIIYHRFLSADYQTMFD